MGVDPEGPEGVVEVEDDEAWEGDGGYGGVEGWGDVRGEGSWGCC